MPAIDHSELNRPVEEAVVPAAAAPAANANSAPLKISRAAASMSPALKLALSMVTPTARGRYTIVR